MRIITYGEIMDKGNSSFIAITQMDGDHLIVEFKGEIRCDNPYRHLADYIDEMEKKLGDEAMERVTINFNEFKYCNSNGFYVLMDIIEIIYKMSKGEVCISRLKIDDWQQRTLPILLNLEDDGVRARTTVKDME